jgi:glycosyltransferase involved in cell wall biosynthesis
MRAASDRSLRIAMLGPIAWRTPPVHYGPWEQVVSTLTEGLVAAGHDVTLFATGNSVTAGRLRSVVEHGYEENRSYDPAVLAPLHIANCFEAAAAGEFDLIHSHLDFLPLAWSGLVDVPMVTTIHGFSSDAIMPAYRRYDGRVHYVAISNADRHPELTYTATIYHGLEPSRFPFRAEPDPDGHVLFFGRIHPDKGTHAAIDIARAAGRSIRIAGIVHDEAYFRDEVVPRLGEDAEYVGPIAGDGRAAELGSASALLHPVAFAEPFGLSVAEAMMCGTPVIAFPCGSMPEIVEPGVTGFLVGDAAQAVAAVAGIAGVDRRRCHATAVRRFGADRMVGEYIDVYRGLLRAGPRLDCGAPR